MESLELVWKTHKKFRRIILRASKDMVSFYWRTLWKRVMIGCIASQTFERSINKTETIDLCK